MSSEATHESANLPEKVKRVSYFKVEAIVKSERTEENLGMFIDGLMSSHLDVEDLVCYEVTYFEKPVPPWQQRS